MNSNIREKERKKGRRRKKREGALIPRKTANCFRRIKKVYYKMLQNVQHIQIHQLKEKGKRDRGIRPMMRTRTVNVTSTITRPDALGLASVSLCVCNI